MKTQKITFGLPKINFKGIKISKPLANLNEPIQDVFVSSKKAQVSSKNEPVSIVAGMKDSKGQPRFSEKEVNDFKISCATNVLDFETVDTFKDNTNFKMSDMKKVYRMGKELKDDKFNEKVINAISKLPKGLKPDEFKQNEYEPEKEFTLYCGSKGKFKFDANTTEMIAKTTFDMNDLQININKEFDFRNNTVTTIKKSYDYDAMRYDILEQTVVKKDKNGNLLREEKMTPSQVKGVYDIEYTYANGKTKQVSKANVDKKTGIKTIKRDIKSDNGTRTQFLYEDDPQGNRIVDYKITNKDGKILMGLSQSFEVVDDNHFISSNNGYKYDISADDKKLKVKDLHHNRETSIDFENKFEGDKKSLISLIKKVPGNELFEAVDNLSKIKSSDNVYQAGFSPVSKKVDIMDNLFVFLHELGHAKDAQKQKTYGEKIMGKNKMFTHNKDIQETYLKERKTFNKYHSEEERNLVSYFTQAKGHYGGEWGGLAEVVAETNAITNTIAEGKISLGVRAQYLQQYFPETIAKIHDAMNWKDDLDAIEYYGT